MATLSQPATNRVDHHRLSDWPLEINAHYVEVGCTTVTREELEGLLAKMKALDPPAAPCWRRLENSSLNSQFESAAIDCLYDLRETLQKLQQKVG